MEYDCTTPSENIEKWTFCNAEAVTAPVVETVQLATGAAVLIAVILAGIVVVKRVVREFGNV